MASTIRHTHTPQQEIIDEIKGIAKQNSAVTPEVIKYIIKLLRWLDTIHDFYPVDATGRGENIRDILNRQFKNVSEFMDAISSKENNGGKTGTITPSDVEKQAEHYYKENFNVINVGKHTIDAKTIVDKYIAAKTKGNEITASKILEEVGVPDYTEVAEMQLKLTDRRFFKAAPSATNFLANVILTFFLGADINRDVYFLIDAAAGRLDCMFQDIDQVSTLINVLTIGDSAVGNPNEVKKTKQENKQDCGVDDFTNKFKRKAYFAEPNTLPYTKDNKYMITSNEFTKGKKITMWYQDADLPFSKQNNASARLYVKYGDKEPWFTEFSILASGAPNSGASVGTLKKLITALNNENKPDTQENRIKTKKAIETIYKYETQFNLTPILCGMLDSDMTKDEIISFLYDYKRAGDHEQANSANYLYKKKGINVILLTGDRLCSLYARLIGQPCIYIHKDEYDMYRNFREVTEDQKQQNAISILTSRKAFILAEIEKIKKDEIEGSLVALKGQIEGFIELPDKFEDSLYNFIFDSLLIKILRLEGLLTAYEAAKAGMISAANKPIDEAEESTVIEEAIKLLNDEYNHFNETYKEIFNFALYSPIDIVEATTAKNKFNSIALDYDNKLVKNILDYFAKFHKKNIVPGASRDKPLAVKKNLINRIGNEDYDVLYGDLLEYLKKCNSYEKKIIDDADDATEILSGMPNVRTYIQTIWTENPNIGDHTFEDYKKIFDEIKAFIFGIIQAPEAAVAQAAAEVAEAQAEEAAPAQAPAAVDISLDEEIPKERRDLIKDEENEKLKLMKISLYEWAKSKELTEVEEVVVPEDLTKDTQIVPIEYNKPLNVVEPDKSEMDEDDKKLTFLETEERKAKVGSESENLSREIARLNAEIGLDDFKAILNAKLENENEIFYSAVEPAAPMEQGGGGMNDDIENLLDNYYANVRIAHYQELVDAYLYSSEDVEKKIITDKMGKIYNYVFKTNLYPETVYDYLYNGLAAAEPVVVHHQVVGVRMTPVRHSIKTGTVSTGFKYPVTPPYTAAAMDEEEEDQIFDRAFQPLSRRLSRQSNSPSPQPFPQPSLGSHPIVVSPTPPYTPDPFQFNIYKNNSHRRQLRLSRTPSVGEVKKLARVPSYRSKGRNKKLGILHPITETETEESAPKRQKVGGKGTRKYKNKRNKKTRNKNKKTKKNKTIKKKKNRKQRKTRRN